MKEEITILFLYVLLVDGAWLEDEISEDDKCPEVLGIRVSVRGEIAKSGVELGNTAVSEEVGLTVKELGE